MGNLAEARIDLEEALQVEPQNAEANLQLGLLLGQQGDATGAREAFRKAVRAKPDWAEAHYNLGLTMVSDPNGKRDWPGAMAEFREALRLRPNYAEAHRLLGVGLAETGQNAAAIVEFRAALTANSHSPEIHLDLGRALGGTGDEAAAEREYREAIRLRPAYADAELELGKLLVSDKKADRALEAVEHFERALRSNPDNAAAQYALAKALQEQGHSAEAAIAFRQAAVLSKRQEDAVQCTRLSNEGLDAAHRHNGDAAVRMLREAVNLRPDAAIAHYNLGLVLADRGELAEGVADVVEAISLAPADARFYLALGQMCNRIGDRRRARVAFERMAHLDPGNGTAAAELIDLNKMNATATIHDSGANDPYEFGATSDTPAAHFAFATVLGRRGDWLNAAAEWLRVLASQPGNVDARNNLAVSYAHLGEDDRAELEFRKALQVSADSAGAHFGLAVLALEHGDKTAAAQELRALIRVQPNYPKAQSLLRAASK
jgi:Flp pilus assembly protein TadD